MRLVITLLLLLHLNTGFCQQSPREKFSAAEIREDFRYLYRMLEASHYNLYVTTPKKIFNREFKKINSIITDSMTLLQAHRLFQPFVALSGVGHCNIAYPFSPAYVNYVMSKGNLFPLDIAIKERRLFISANYSSDSNITIGDEVIAINNIPAATYIKRMYKYLSGEREYLKNTQIDLLFFPRVNWLVHDRADNYTLTIKRRNGNTIRLKVNAVAAMEYEMAAGKKKPVVSSSQDFKLIGDVAYLHPGVFLNPETGTNIGDHKALGRGRFNHFIDSCFRIVRQSGVQNLIVDLRGNPGGDNSFSDEMISYFADKPFWFCSRFSVKTSELTKNFWQDISDTQLISLKKLILENENGRLVDLPITKFRPKPDSLRFKGKVYVLINRYSYSNAATSAALIQDYQFGTIIGEETADAPSILAAIHQFSLPLTSMIVSYPKAWIIRPNGDTSPRGVIPDIYVADVPFCATDEMLKSTLKRIER